MFVGVSDGLKNIAPVEWGLYWPLLHYIIDMDHTDAKICLSIHDACFARSKQVFFLFVFLNPRSKVYHS